MHKRRRKQNLKRQSNMHKQGANAGFLKLIYAQQQGVLWGMTKKYWDFVEGTIQKNGVSWESDHKKNKEVTPAVQPLVFFIIILSWRICMKTTWCLSFFLRFPIILRSWKCQQFFGTVVGTQPHLCSFNSGPVSSA
jgi:hypothetical protein